jgi:hypothetical protein
LIQPERRYGENGRRDRDKCQQGTQEATHSHEATEPGNYSPITSAARPTISGSGVPTKDSFLPS